MQKEMVLGTVVKNTITKKKGVVITDRFGVCSPEEILVVYDGTSSGLGTDHESLEIIGPENAVADLEKCGANTKECCIFLTMAASGPECDRFGSLRDNIIFRENQMNATRHPTQMYPECQL